MPIFIEWTEERKMFSHWRYVGNGQSDPIFLTYNIHRKLRYSNDDSLLERARAYLAEFKRDHPDARLVTRREQPRC